MWLVLLKSSKDWFLGVAPLPPPTPRPEQPVPPRVQYGTTCLLISDTIESVSYSIAWRITQEAAWDPHGARGA
jgi:hypothetical protein